MRLRRDRRLVGGEPDLLEDLDLVRGDDDQLARAIRAAVVLRGPRLIGARVVGVGDTVAVAVRRIGGHEAGARDPRRLGRDRRARQRFGEHLDRERHRTRQRPQRRGGVVARRRRPTDPGHEAGARSSDAVADGGAAREIDGEATHRAERRSGGRGAVGEAGAKERPRFQLEVEAPRDVRLRRGGQVAQAGAQPRLVAGLHV